jgi:predicted nucleic acid-binding Zn ribbon protein
MPKNLLEKKKNALGKMDRSWICPWCGHDCHRERNYYYHIKKCPARIKEKPKNANKIKPVVEHPIIIESFVINFNGNTDGKTKPEIPDKKINVEPKALTELTIKNPVVYHYYCGKCGHKMVEKEKYCSECGEALEYGQGTIISKADLIALGFISVGAIPLGLFYGVISKSHVNSSENNLAI